MNRSLLILILASGFVGLLGACLVVWAAWLRPHLHRLRQRTASPYSLVAPFTDFANCLVYGRGQPRQWFVTALAVLFMALMADLLFLLMILVLGVGRS